MTALVIAGGGLAGAAAACGLAQAGLGVTVLERSTGPSDKICGDFLSAEAQHYLRRLGLDPVGLGGHQITQVRVVRGASIAQSTLPFRGLGLSRRVLDEALLVHAGQSGAEIRRGVNVACLSPDITFLATGKHDLRGAARVLGRPPEALVGFKMYLRLAPAMQLELSGAVEVILFDDGYAGLQMVERGQANLCLLIPAERLARSGGTWAGLLDDLQHSSPHLRRRLHGAEMLLARPLAIARVPYGFIHAPDPAETVYRLGDQACVIPSFSGDGMSMALHSAALAVRCYRDGLSPARYHARLRDDVRRPIGRACALYRIGQSRPGQALLVQALQLWPRLLRTAASATRVAEPAWLRD
jgi:flavin-dependent dehydrogenase